MNLQIKFNAIQGLFSIYLFKFDWVNRPKMASTSTIYLETESN